MRLRDFQKTGIKLGLESIREGIRSKTPTRLLMSAPTGSGKTPIQTEIWSALKRDGIQTAIITPRVEILEGFKGSVDERDLWTPITLRNRILDGEISPDTFDAIIVDEAHHATAETYQLINAVLSAPAVGFTATPYRATPRSTQALRSEWGDPKILLTWSQAVRDGYVGQPVCRTRGLVNDDKITVRNGEFVVKSIASAYASKLGSLAELISVGHQRDGRPMMVAVPTQDIAHELKYRLLGMGCPGETIIQSTPRKERDDILDRTRKAECVLIQIGVIGEGVNLPELRVMIDARPTMSPVQWLQQVGRITRPGEDRPLYVCTNRNLERHGYLFEGFLPQSVIKEAQREFGGLCKSAAGRVLGLERLNKFKALSVVLNSGVETNCYNLFSHNEDGAVTEYFVLVVPGHSDPIIGSRVNIGSGDTRVWGKWRKDTLPVDMNGFQTSQQRYGLSDKQRAWYRKSARRYGLDPNAKVSARVFQVLPFLTNLGIRIKDE